MTVEMAKLFNLSIYMGKDFIKEVQDGFDTVFEYIKALYSGQKYTEISLLILESTLTLSLNSNLFKVEVLKSENSIIILCLKNIVNDQNMPDYNRNVTKRILS